MKKRIVVVGVNHAGTHSVKTIAQNYSDSAEVICYDKNDNISFLGCGMALWIGNVINSPDGLFYSNPEELDSLGISVHMKHEVTSIDYENKKLYITNLETNESFEDTYDSLILGVGSWPILPKSIPGLDLDGVHYAKIFQNAQSVIERLDDSSVKRVAIVGGGYIGVELAESFEQNGKETILITSNKVLNGYYDEEFQNDMQKNLEEHNINVNINECLNEIVGKDGKVSKVITDKSEYEVDMVLMSIGFKPATSQFEDSNLDMLNNGAFKVDNFQETSIKDVYAIGDCASIYNNASQSDDYIALASNAVRTGIVAGHNAVNRETISMQGVQGSNAISIYGLNLCSTGLTEEKAKALNINFDSITHKSTVRAEFMPTNEEVTIKIVWDKDTKKILGCQLKSKYDVSLALHMFSMAIQEGYTIDKLALLDLFFLPHFNQPHNFITEAGLLALNKL